MRRRDAILGLVTLLAVLATLPAYGRVFAEPAWRGPAVVTVVVALALAAVLRSLRVPWWAALAVSVGTLALLTTALYLTPEGLLPGVEQWPEVRALFAQGLADISETPSPAPTLPSLLLLLTTGLWAVTHLAHELVVRWRRSGLALVPLLVLWAVPLAITTGEAPALRIVVPFLAGAALLLLLSAPDALPVADRPLSRATGSGLTVGAAAIAIAVVTPGILPGYDAEGWFDLGSGADPRGYQPIVDVSDRLKLPEDRDVLRVRTDQKTYLRLAGLDSFDGFTWRLGPTGEGSYRPDPSSLYSARDVLPPEAEAAEVEPLFAEVEVLELQNIYVPVPYQPVEVLGPQRSDMVWSTEGGFLATWDTVDGELAGQPRIGVREGMGYRVRALRAVPTADQLREVEADEATRERFTELPREYEALRTQAEDVYAAADADTTVDRVLALQDWFIGDGGGFTYDLDVPALRGDRALEQFVLEDKVGYCEYFATAMAVMLRETGVPARVAVGFLPGRLTTPAEPEEGRELDEYTVSTRDAHAWVEVLFPGYGWITFDPTPRADRTQMVPREDNLTPLENERERAARERAEQQSGRGENERHPTLPDATPQLPEQDLAPTRPGTSAADTSSGWVVWTLALAGLALVAAALWLLQRRARVGGAGDDPAGRIVTAQRRVLAAAASLGLDRRPSETATEVLTRWLDEDRIGEDGARFARLAQAAAFGGRVDEDDANDAEALADRIIEALRASVEPRDRALATVRVPVTQGVQRTRELVGTVRDRWRG